MWFTYANTCSWKYISKKGSINPYAVSQCVRFSPSGMSRFYFSRHVHQTLEKFMASGDEEFDDDHIPTTIKLKRKDRDNPMEYRVSLLCNKK